MERVPKIYILSVDRVAAKTDIQVLRKGLRYTPGILISRSAPESVDMTLE